MQIGALSKITARTAQEICDGAADALEVTAPGAFMLWLGIAALITGLVLFVAPLGWEMAALLFAVLAAASVLAGRYITRTGREPSAEREHARRREQQGARPGETSERMNA